MNFGSAQDQSHLAVMAVMSLAVFPWLAPAQSVVPLAGVTLCLLAVNLA